MRLSLVVVLMLAACAAPGTSSPADVDGAWQLVSGRAPAGPVPIVEDRPITLTIDGDDVSGTAACNQYGGRFVRLPGDGVRIEDLAMTAMGCEPDVAASEAAYAAALAAVDAVERQAETLVLAGPDTELRFEALPPPPTSELVGTVWVLETVVVGDVASSTIGERATLVLRADGTFRGSTGCRSFEGSWVERGDRIVDLDMAMDGSECPPDVIDQDSIVVSVVGDGFVPTIDGQLLTLTDPGGAGLVFRAGD